MFGAICSPAPVRGTSIAEFVFPCQLLTSCGVLPKCAREFPQILKTGSALRKSEASRQRRQVPLSSETQDRPRTAAVPCAPPCSPVVKAFDFLVGHHDQRLESKRNRWSNFRGSRRAWGRTRADVSKCGETENGGGNFSTAGPMQLLLLQLHKQQNKNRPYSYRHWKLHQLCVPNRSSSRQGEGEEQHRQRSQYSNQHFSFRIHRRFSSFAAPVSLGPRESDFRPEVYAEMRRCRT